MIRYYVVVEGPKYKMRRHEFNDEEEAIDFARWALEDPFTYTSVRYYVTDRQYLVFEVQLWWNPDNLKKETHRWLYDAYKKEYVYE